MTASVSCGLFLYRLLFLPYSVCDRDGKEYQGGQPYWPVMRTVEYGCDLSGGRLSVQPAWLQIGGEQALVEDL